MPGTADIGKNIRELKEADKRKPKGKRRPQAQRIAIAMEQARKASSGKVPPKPKGKLY